MYEKVIERLEPQKVYKFGEILKAISPSQSSTASHILQDLLASGRIEQVLHPVLGVNGYKLKQ